MRYHRITPSQRSVSSRTTSESPWAGRVRCRDGLGQARCSFANEGSYVLRSSTRLSDRDRERGQRVMIGISDLRSRTGSSRIVCAAPGNGLDKLRRIRAISSPTDIETASKPTSRRFPTETDANVDVPVQIRTSCEQKRAEDDQRWR